MFAGRPIGAGEDVGYYYGSLVYPDIGRERHLKKIYGDDVLAVTVEHFSKWALKILGATVDSRGFELTS